MRFVCSLICLLLLSSWDAGMVRAAPQSSTAVVAHEEAPPPSAWHTFRTRFPFHIQTLAATAPDAEGRRTLIVSEPPLSATLAGIRGVDPILLASGTVHTWAVGHDGWVRDVVFDLPATTLDEFQELVSGLSRHLFGTDYKAFVLDLPVTADVFRMKYPLDIRVTVGEVEAWYQNLDFVPLGGGGATRLGTAPHGVYTSAEPGLVAWIVPKRGIEQKRGDARRFALDSDLIIGAVDRGSSVVILARERQVPVIVLPPLRWEMIRDLAAATGEPLAQSYERNLFAAGPTWEGWDWAPIYLSPELLDSEYGSVLNCTDQMLKGWSLAGLVEYRNFPHPLPERLPFDGPLTARLGAEQLLFNWNTAGFGVTSRTDQGVIYATNRTGALPVTYRPDNQPIDQIDPDVALAEEQAYAYYASLNNPMLARVVQYTALYQIFRGVGVVAPAREWPVWDQAAGLKRVALRVLLTMRSAGDQVGEEAVRKIMADTKRRTNGVGMEGIDPDELKGLLVGLLDLYRSFIDEHGAGGERALVGYLASTRDRAPELVDDEDLQFDLLFWTMVLRESPLTALCDGPGLQELFSRSRAVSDGEAWIRTPTVVYSRTLGPLVMLSGGHNLDPYTVRVIRDASQPSGKVSLTPDGAVRCNPSDAAAIECRPGIIARTTNRDELIARLEQLIKRGGPPASPRAHPIALELGAPSPQPLARGLNQSHLDSSNPGGNRSLPPGKSFATNVADGIGGSGDVLLVSVSDGQAIRIRRHSPDGTLTEGEYWSPRDASFAIRSQIEGAAKPDAGQPLRIRFDESCTDAFADRMMRDVAKTGSVVAGGSPKESHRFVVLFRAARHADVALNQPVQSLAVAGQPRAQLLEGAVHRVTARIDATVGGHRYPIEFDAYLVRADGLNDLSLGGALRDSTRNAVDLTLVDVPEYIMNDLMTTFRAAQGQSTLRATIPDIGDFTISRFEHGGRTIGAIVLAEGTR